MTNTAPSFSIGSGYTITEVGVPAGISGSYGTAIQAGDGRIVTTGISYNAAGYYETTLARYNADGSLDTSFDGDGILTVHVGTSNAESYDIALQSDGKILVSGSSTVGSSLQSQFTVYRFNADGSLDTTFGGGDGIVTASLSGTHDYGDSLLVQSDGTIIVAGTASYYTGNLADIGILRLDTDGNVLSATVTDVAAHDFSVSSATTDGAGNILVTGQVGVVEDSTMHERIVLARYTSAGAINTSFGGGDGIVVTDLSGNSELGRSVSVQSDGKILVAGHDGDALSATRNLVVVRYESSGNLDASFGSGGIVSLDFAANWDEGYEVLQQVNGQLVVAGFATVDSMRKVALARLNADGTLDGSFGIGGKVVADIPGGSLGLGIALQSDGRIVVSGQNGINNLLIARINTDGSLDTTFGGGASTLDGTPTYALGDAPVVLDANVQVSDAEFDAAGSYQGATLTLERHGGASADDVFSYSGFPLPLGTTLFAAGAPVADVIQSSGGRLVLQFNANAAQSHVNLVMQAIGYANTGTTAGPVQIDWTFSDNVAGESLSATGSTTVNVLATDTAPPIVTSITADQPSTTSSHTINYTVTFSEAVTGLDAGDFSLSYAGGMTGVGISGLASRSGSATDTTWIVTVDAGPDPGFVQLVLADGSGITDLAGSALALPWRTQSSITSFDGRAPDGITGPFYVAAGDVNGDGWLDIVTSNPNDNRVAVLLGDGSGGFIQDNVYQIDGAPLGQGEAYASGGGATPYATPTDLTLADLDGDGDLDMAVAILEAWEAGGLEHSGVAIRWNDGAGNFGGSAAFDYYEGVGAGPRRVVAGDLDADGNVDLIVANSYEGTVSIMLSDGSGGFLADGAGVFPAYAAGGTGPGDAFDIKLGDADGDGIQDIVGVNSTSRDAFVLRGIGDGTFDPFVVSTGELTTTGAPRSLDIGDLDGDGDLDAVVVNDIANDVKVLLGNGDGTFVIGDTYAVDDRPFSIDLGDLNGDGRLDFAVANRSSDTITVYHGLGDGTFAMHGDVLGSSPSLPITGAYPTDVVIADADGDGYADIIAPGYHTTEVFTLFGETGFYASPLINIADNTPPVTVNDTVTTDEDTAVTINVLANDSDAQDGTPVPGTVTEAYGAANGAVTINADGTITYTPGANFSGTDSFTYELTDSDGATATATVEVTVDPVNDAPVLSLPTGSTYQFVSAYGISWTDANAAAQAMGGHLVTITSEAENDYLVTVFGSNGDYWIGLTDAAVEGVYQWVTGEAFSYANWANEQPDNYEGDEDYVSGHFNFPGFDGGWNDNPDVPIYNQRAGYIVEFDGSGSGSVRFTENDRPVSIAPDLTITDIDNATLSGAIVTISDGFVDGEDVLLVTPEGDITASYDAGTGELTLLGEASLAEYQATLRSLAYLNTSEDPATRPRVISIQVDDGETLNNLSNFADVTIEITAVNDAPEFTLGAATVTVNEDAGAQVVPFFLSGLTAVEPGQTTTVSITSDNPGLFASAPALVAANGTLTFQTAANANGTATVTVTVTDDGGTANGGADTTTRTFQIVVDPVNDAPQGAVALSGPAGVPFEHYEYSALTATISDADGLGPLHHQWQRGSTLDGPFTDIAGATASTYRLEDGDGYQFVRAVVSYTDGGGTLETLMSVPTGPVVPVNDAPTGSVVILGDAIEDSVLTADVSGLHDDDGIGTILYQWERGDGTSFAIIPGATLGTYQLTDADVGKQIRVQVSYVDGSNAYEIVRSASTSEIVNINDPPAGTLTISGFLTEHEQLSVDINAITDGDGKGSGTIQWQRAESAAGTFMDIAGATGTQYLTGDADAAQYLRVAYRYTDLHGTEEVVTTAPAYINNINDAPTAEAGIAATGDEDTVIPVTLRGADIDPGDSVQYFRLMSLPFGGTLHLLDPRTATGPNPALFLGDYAATSGTLTLYFNPEPDYNNTVSFQYRAVDTLGTTSITQEVQITINPVNDAPAIVNLLQDRSFGDNQLVSFQIPSDAFQDVDHTMLTYTATLEDGSPLPSWLGFDAVTRSFSGRPPNNTTQDYSIRVTAMDAQGLSTFDDFVLHIVHVNNAPTGQVFTSPQAAREDGTLTAFTDNLVDEDGLGPFSYSWERGLGGAFTAIEGANGASYTPGQGDVGSQIRVVVSYIDAGGTAETVVGEPTTPVLNVNDAPTGAVPIIGTPQEDSPLAIDTSAVADEDGIIAMSTLLQWQRWNGSTFSDIPGANGATYTPGDDDAGRDIRVSYRYVDGYGTIERLFSDPIHIENVNDAPGGNFTLLFDTFFQVSRAFEDQTYSVNPGAITDADGMGSGTLQWQRADSAAGSFTDIAGATNTQYTTGDADAGKYLRAVYRYTDGQGTQETAATPSVPVENVNDGPTGYTAHITGSSENEPFTLVLDGEIADADGGAGPLSYQWARRVVTNSGVEVIDIPGANGTSYTPDYDPVAFSAGAEYLRLRISYTDGFGTPETIDVYSNQIVWVNDGPVLSHIPVNVAYREGDDPIILAPAAVISDEEFDSRNNGLGDYSGSALLVTPDTLGSDDRIGLAPMTNISVHSLTATTGELLAGGNVIATYALSNRATILFSQFATTALVQEIARAITYQSLSDTPPSSVGLTFELQDSLSIGGNPTVHVTVDIELADNPPSFGFPFPIPGGGTFDVLEGSTLGADLSASDPDGQQSEGSGLRYSIVGGADAGKLDIDPATGVLTFRVAPNFEAPDDAGGDRVYEVRVRVAEDDGAGVASEANVELRVLDANVPVADTAVATGLEDTTIPLTLVGRNLDADQPIDTFRLLALPDHGTLYLDPVLRTADVTVQAGVDYAASGNSLRLYFVPDLEFSGSVGFGFTAASGPAGTVLQSAVIHVSGVNDAPVVSNASPPVFTENGPAVRLFQNATVSDAEHDSLNGGLGDYNGFSIVLTAPEPTVMPTPHSFGFSTMANVLLEDTHLPGTKALRAGGQLIGIVSAVANGIQIYFDATLAGQYGGTGATPTRALVNEVLQAATYANTSDNPPPTVPITYSVTDRLLTSVAVGGPVTTTGTVSVEIQQINDAPTNIVLSNTAVAEFAPNATVVGRLATIDADDSAGFSYALLNNAGGRFAISGGEIVVANGVALDYEQVRTHTVTVRSTDQGGRFVDKSLVINLVDVNPERVVGTDAGETIVGGARDDFIYGRGGRDTLRGRDGNDTLDGGTSNDRLEGGAGNDTYFVDNLGDVLVETSGVDLVNSTVTWTLAPGFENLTLSGNASINGTGNAAANTIIGNDRANVITGGAGRDVMTGGDGADYFVFNAVAETGATFATRDIIRDFRTGVDHIDLHLIDANGPRPGDSFQFIAKEGAAFGTIWAPLAGQLRWYQIDAAGTGNDRTIIEGDVNGDRRPDFQIELVGLKNLTVGDFIL